MLLLWSTILSSIGGILLGLLVLIKAPKKYGNIFFALVSIIISFVVAANYFSLTNKNSAELTLFWIRTVMFLVPYLILVMYYFASSYLNEDFKFNYKKLVFFSLLAIVLSIINISPLAYISVQISSTGNIVPETGFGLMLNGLYIIPIFGMTIYAMLRNIKLNQNRKEKRMIKFAFYAMLLSFGIQIITSFVIVLVFNYTVLVPLGSFLTFAFIALMTFAILYFRAFNIKLVGAVLFAIILALLMFADIFYAVGLQNIAYRVIVFLAVSFVGYQFIGSVYKEIAQRKKLQKLTEDLKVLNQKLKELDAMKTEFVSVASHELLTPISAIEGYLSMMLDEKMVKIEDPKAVEYLGNVYQSAKRLAKLVADLLNVSRIEQGRLLVQKSLIKMRDVIHEVLTELKFKASDAKLELTSHIPDDVHTAVYADADKIKEVLVNLCGNSLKFTKPGGKVQVSAEVWSTDKLKEKYEQIIKDLQQKEEVEGSLAHTVNKKASELLGDHQLVISVKDTGIGISKDGLAQLFQKFSRVGSWSQHSIPGTGLGLYISKSLVEMHHGRIWAESEGEGKGSTFYFTLPMASAKKEIQKIDKEALPTAKDAKPLARTGLEGQIQPGQSVNAKDKKPESGAEAIPTAQTAPVAAHDNDSSSSLKAESHLKTPDEVKTLAGEDLTEEPKLDNHNTKHHDRSV